LKRCLPPRHGPIFSARDRLVIGTYTELSFASRHIRVLWTSNFCNSPGAQVIITHVWLRVRVGVFTRTEDIPLLSGWALAGTKTSHPAHACG
jgi:hypothetical protein